VVRFDLVRGGADGKLHEVIESMDTDLLTTALGDPAA
jgi:hypothetical protein